MSSPLYGALTCGAAKGYKHVNGVFIGAGVGSALVINGRLPLGASGRAGNIGRFLIDPLGVISGAPELGILDSIASRTAIAAEAAALAARHRAPHLFEISGCDVRQIK